MKSISSAYRNMCIKLFSLMSLSFFSIQSYANLDAFSNDRNVASSRSLSDITGNIETAAEDTATLIIQLVTIGGFVVVAISLYQLYKASKDEREKPTSAIVGLFIGGAMAAVGVIMYMMRNTIVG